MKPRQRVSKSGLELIKRFEGFRPKAARLAGGGWTMGYGHVRFAKEGADVSEADAEVLLAYDVMAVAETINSHVFTPLSQNQFDALASFVFNVGAEGFVGSTVLRRINEGEFAKAAYALEMWRRSNFEGEPLVVDALVRRRAAEKALFLTPDDGFVPAPTPVLPPRVDYGADLRPPAERPVELVAPMEGPIAEARRVVGEGTHAPVVMAEDTPAEVLYEPEAAPVQDDAFELPAEEEPTADPVIHAAAASEGVRPFPAVGELHLADPQPSPTPSEPAAPETIESEVLSEVVHPPVSGKSLIMPVSMAIIGVLLFGFAIFWGLSGAADADPGDHSVVSYLIGIVGVICVFAAAYMILDRLAADDV